MRDNKIRARIVTVNVRYLITPIAIALAVALVALIFTWSPLVALACFSGVSFLIYIPAIYFLSQTKEDPDKHIYIKHPASGEWGHFPPGQHPLVALRHFVFTVIPFEYEWKKETQEVTIPGEGKATATILWRPSLDDLNLWIESDRQGTVAFLQKECVRESSNAFQLIVRRLPKAQRERLVGVEIPLDPPEMITGRGITAKNLTLTITRLPEPQPAPSPQEPWENYEELHIGDQNGKPVFLDDDDMITHVQIIGASRYGKSKLVEYAMRQTIHGNAEGVCVIDPNEQLYDDLLTWCAHRRYLDGTVQFLDPSDEHSAIGFNPFRLEGERTPDRISARANRLQATTLKALGTRGDAVQAERIIKCLYYVLIEQDLPVTDLNAFMVPRLFDRRDEIMAACQSEAIRDQWEMLTAGKGVAAYVNMMQSSANRLFDIIAERGVQRIFTNPKPINLWEITTEGHTLLVNLSKSDIFPLAARDTIGAFLVDEIWDIMSNRTKEQSENLPPFNFAIDEFHNFATPEFARMLKEGGKYGLHLWVINHSLEDLDHTVRNALKACHTRIAFGGTSQKDAAAVMEGSRPAQGNDLRSEISSIPGLNKRVFALHRTQKRNLFCATPWVEEYKVQEKTKQAYLKYLTRMPESDAAPILAAREAAAEAPAPKATPTPQQAKEVASDDFYH